MRVLIGIALGLLLLLAVDSSAQQVKTLLHHSDFHRQPEDAVGAVTMCQRIRHLTARMCQIKQAPRY
jgi:hypothetical protein